MHSSPMASKARKFPFLTLIATYLSISINGNSVNSPPPPCAAFDCGNGLTLSYPFHLQTNQPPPLCGYPDLAISCTNNQPNLHISKTPYTVKKINISDNSITVAYGGGAATCPIATHAVEMESDSILSCNNSGNKIVHFYYNCTVYPPPSSSAGIKCLQRGAKQSFAFPEGSEPDSDWIHYCESDLAVPVIGNDRNGSGNALELGFKLTWESSRRRRSCEVCENSGGFCGYNSNHNFICFCSNGENTSLSCHHAGEISKTTQPNYVAIGAVVIGGVVALTIVVFFINKIRLGVRKHGFNRLPTTYGK